MSEYSDHCDTNVTKKTSPTEVEHPKKASLVMDRDYMEAMEDLYELRHEPRPEPGPAVTCDFRGSLGE